MKSLPANTDQDYFVSWDQYHRLVERLALTVHESGWQMDQILCLARGGLRVGDVLSRIFDVPLAILATSSYREAAGTVQGELDIARHITMTKGTHNGSLYGRVLLVDDMVDTGNTFTQVRDHIRQHFAGVTDVRTAVLWSKGHSKVKPDYQVEHLPTNPWIHQPFEEYDTLRPQHLAAWLGQGKHKLADLSQDESIGAA